MVNLRGRDPSWRATTESQKQVLDSDIEVMTVMNDNYKPQLG